MADLAQDPDPEWLAERLPTVLAVPLGDYLREPHPVLVLWHLCDLTELALRFLVMAAVAEHQGRVPAALAKVLHQHIERPTLGSWRAMAQAVAAAPAASTMLPELPAAVAALNQLLGSHRDAPDSGLLALRNRLAHGGGLGRAPAQRLVEIWRPRAAVMLASLAFLVETQLAAVGAEGGVIHLVGQDPQTPAPSNLTLAAVPGQEHGLWLMRDGRSLALWPLGCYDGTAGFEQPQLYMRRDEVRLLYTVLGGEAALGESLPDALQAFLQLFRLDADEGPPVGLQVRGFEAELRRESARRVGRTAELAAFLDAARAPDLRLLWLSGPPGVGKSNLMACAATDLLDQPPENTLFLPFRFRSADDRCSRDSFLRFAAERLAAWGGISAADAARAQTLLQPMERLRWLLGGVQPGHRAVFLLDGLDEIAARDPGFARDVVLPVFRAGGRCVCAGRPDYGLAEVFHSIGAAEPFAGGLPSMSASDVRAMLLNHIDRLRHRLIKRDREGTGGVRNPFVERVLQLSEGLPLYIGYVIGDLASGQLTPESEGRLPTSLHAYHAELLRRCTVGDLHATMTPLVALLALAREPLVPQAIAALLVRRRVLATPNVPLVERALAAVASMVRRVPGPEGENGYVLYHHSLRVHVLDSDQMTETVAVTRACLVEAATQPTGDAAETYLLRAGVAHLVEEGRCDLALTRLMDFPATMHRLTRLGSGLAAADGWYDDWQRVRSVQRIAGDAAVWWDFAREIRHHFQKVGWPAQRVLFQAAMDHADQTPVTQAAERFSAAGNAEFPWIRLVNRPRVHPSSPTLAVLAGHSDWIRGVLTLDNGRLLAWANAAKTRGEGLRVWDCATGAQVAAFGGYAAGIGGAVVLRGSRVVSWLPAESVLKVWDGATGAQIAVLAGHTRPVRGAAVLAGGDILSWSARTLRRWDAETHQLLAVFEGHSADIGGALELASGQILSWSAGAATGAAEGEPPVLRIWAGAKGAMTGALLGHLGAVTGVLELPGARALSWSRDGTARVWDIASGIELAVLSGHAQRMEGALCVDTQRVLTWSADSTLRLWDSTSGSCEAVLAGHKYAVSGAIGLPDGRILSWSTEPTLRLWDGRTGAQLAVVQGHEDAVRGAQLLAGGQLLTWSDDETLRLWDGETMAPLGVFAGHRGAVRGAGELADGRLWSRSLDETVRIWDATARVAHRPKIDGHDDFVWSTKVLGDGDVLSWSVDCSLRLWSGADGRRMGTLLGHTEAVNSAQEVGTQQLLSRAPDGLRLWDRATGDCLWTLAEPAKTDGVLLLSDKRVLTWSEDGNLRLYQLHSAQPQAVLAGHQGPVRGALELRDGNIVSWADDRTLRFWSGKDGQGLAILERHRDLALGVVELSDGRLLSWSKDHTLRLWDSADGSQLAVLEGHSKGPGGAFELADGRVVSWSTDETLRIWASTGAAEAVLSHPGELGGACALADGRLLSWSADTVLLWELDAPGPLAVFHRNRPEEMQAAMASVVDPPAVLVRQFAEALSLEPCSCDSVVPGGRASATHGRFVRIQQLMRGDRCIGWEAAAVASSATFGSS